MSKSSYSLLHFPRPGIPVLMNVSRKNLNFHVHAKFLSGKSTMLKSRIFPENWPKKEKYTLDLQQRVQIFWRVLELLHRKRKPKRKVYIQIMCSIEMNYNYRTMVLATCIPPKEDRQKAKLIALRMSGHHIHKLDNRTLESSVTDRTRNASSER